MAPHKLFGTDGVRGIANLHPVSAEIAVRLGRAAARVLTEKGRPVRDGDGRRARIVIGKDTRLSGYMLESAILAGVTSMGADVILIGPMPSPGVAYITRSLRADAGIVLTASHNPYEDNGIKFFRHDGYKLDDAVEEEIESLVAGAGAEFALPTAGALGRATRIDDAVGRYVEHAKQSFPRSLTLEHLKIALDCANGASYKSSPAILRELGAEVVVTSDRPDGMNINRDCGSTHPGNIARLVLESGAHVGISHDGDADRVVLADERGDIVDGDEILAMAAIDALERGNLAKNTLVATVMSNCALDALLASRGGHVVRTGVGDRNVIAEMLASGFNIGGEQSGHLIFRDFSTTGDGIVSALQILRIMVETGRPLSELRKILKKFPQAQRNLRVASKPPFGELAGVADAVRQAEEEMGGRGRVLLRYSGTESKARLLIEGEDASRIGELADRIATLIDRQIGA